MGEPQKRLIWLRERLFGERGKSAMARLLGIRLTTYVRYEESRALPFSLAEKLVVEKRVNPAWLYHGKGEAFLPEGAEVGKVETAAELIADLWLENDRLRSELVIKDQAAGYEQSPVLAVIPAGVRADVWMRERGRIEAEAESCVAVPILGGEIAAGPPRNVFEEEIEGWAICYRSAIRSPQTTSAVRVRGDSMLPVIPDGSLVGVDHGQREPAGIYSMRSRFVAVRSDDGCVIRQMERADGHWLFLPTNPSEENRPLVWAPAEGENPIVGRVIFVFASYE